MDTAILIMKPINATFFLCCALFAAFAFIFIRIFRKKSLKTKRTAVAVLYALVTIWFFVYKWQLSLDAEYSAIREAAGLGSFSWLCELPLHLCNINMILAVVAMITMFRPILSFVFFASTIGAAFSILMPVTGFYDCSILLPRMTGYYGTHFFVLILMPLLAGLNLYRPEWKDIPGTTAASVIIMSCMTLVSLGLRTLESGARANYFYTIEPDGNPILELLHRLIPIPGVYLLPALLIFVPYMLLVTWLFQPKRRK